MDFLSHEKNKFDLWKTEGHLGYQGSHTWPNEGTTVTRATDLKSFIHRRLFVASFKSERGHEILSTAILRFHARPKAGPRVDQLNDQSIS
jgi:hypothetical protein